VAESLSILEARRLAIAAQGFGARGKRVDRRAVKKLLDAIAPLQIDSVNVLQRTHYIPIFSRLGPYRSAILDEMAYERRDLFEYWGHMASFMPVEQFPLMRWKMRNATTNDVWKMIAETVRKRPTYVEDVYAEVKARGPISASELSDPGKKAGPWWGWGAGKHALEWLFYCGRITTAGRRNFERVYDLTERVIPKEIYERTPPSEHDARRELLLHSARAHGVGTAKDLFDYFRLNLTKTRPVLAECVAAGELLPVRVEGWKDEAYVLPGTAIPRRARANALVSPFDPLVWYRERTERLFDFFYRIEIYTPPPKRIHGYYVLPFLMDEELVARVDLKADRQTKTLLVQGAFAETGMDRKKVAAALIDELRAMEMWLGLEKIAVRANGDLARPLQSAMRAHTR
jgi:uncharacterized protein YcaQ